MSKQLLIMRHAKSDWYSGAEGDFDRPLNDRGRKDAKRMGRWLKDQKLIPGEIVCSPALRARETALAVCKETGFDKADIQWEPDIYGAGLETLLDLVQTRSETADLLLLIGHNPGLDELVEALCKETPPTSESGKLMTTAAIAIFSYRGLPSKGELDLVQMVRPKEIK